MKNSNSSHEANTNDQFLNNLVKRVEALEEAAVNRQVEQMHKRLDLLSGEPALKVTQSDDLTIEEKNRRAFVPGQPAPKSPMQSNFDEMIAREQAERIAAETERFNKETKEEFEAKLYESDELNRKIKELNDLRRYAKDEEKRNKI